MIVAFPGHTHLFYFIEQAPKTLNSSKITSAAYILMHSRLLSSCTQTLYMNHDQTAPKEGAVFLKREQSEMGP